jgi:hypothetical protein
MYWKHLFTPAPPRKLNLSHSASMVLILECKLINRQSDSKLELTSFIRLQDTANFGEGIIYSDSGGPE